MVSIIVPCFNAAPWLAETLESALAQTWPNKEIIVIDDGSTDASVGIGRQFESRGVAVATQCNLGASAARNHALGLAHGHYIQFLDADDLLAPDKITQQVAALRAAPTNRIAAGPWGRFKRDIRTAIFTPEENWRDAAPIDWLALNFAGRGMMPPAAWLMSRPLAEAAGPWDERLTLNDDGEYFCRVLLRSTGVRFCAEARTFYRSNLPSSLSRRRSEASWRSALFSQELSMQHLLTVEDSPRTRRACADLMQRLAHAAWPDAPAVVARAEDLARVHGGSDVRPGGGRAFRLLTVLFGWKFARRIQQRRRN